MESAVVSIRVLKSTAYFHVLTARALDICMRLPLAYHPYLQCIFFYPSPAPLNFTC